MVSQLQRQLTASQEEVTRNEAIAEARAQSVVDAQTALEQVQLELASVQQAANDSAAAAAAELSRVVQECDLRIAEKENELALSITVRSPVLSFSNSSPLFLECFHPVHMIRCTSHQK